MGHGQMGHNHSRVLGALGHDVITVDPRGGELASVGELTDADAACISTPPAHLVISALQSRVPVYLIEKPMATTMEGAQALVDEHPDASVGYTERHNPAVIALRDNLYRVGDVVHTEAKRLGGPSRNDLPPRLDLSTHDIDALRFCGIDPGLPDWDLRFGHETGHTPGRTFCASHIHPFKERTLRIIGTDGELRLDYQHQRLTFAYPGGCLDLSPRYEEPLRRMWQAILDDQPTATVQDGVEALFIAGEIMGDQVAAA